MTIVEMQFLFADLGTWCRSLDRKRQGIMSLSIGTSILFHLVDGALEQQQGHSIEQRCVNSSLQHTPRRQS